ncbi:hypothetical protein DPMN_039630 [Dreissena polymorpha]|uniref:Uncharacterized protein n=1 Tax=Dreissena polymorpha TaxID=45954 RepID=A0A9D4CVL8_DREPO|nr:hypothetical protein DPMN_039630 [Dreissena polymorpha]
MFISQRLIKIVGKFLKCTRSINFSGLLVSHIISEQIGRILSKQIDTFSHDILVTSRQIGHILSGQIGHIHSGHIGHILYEQIGHILSGSFSLSSDYPKSD